MTDEYIRPPAVAADIDPRLLSVASLIARAKTNKQIAAELGISTRYLRTRINALAYLIHLNRGDDVRVQIANWWRAQTPDIRRDRDAA